MSTIVEKNEMGGKSFYVFSEADIAEIPAKLRRLVGQEERLALSDSTRYFHDLARGTKCRSLQKWLIMLGECDKCFLELHTASSTLYPGFPSAVYLRVSLDNGTAPGIKLRSSKEIPSLPATLAEVYERIDGINHCGFGMGGELLSATEISPFSQPGIWISETNKVDPETTMLFYTTSNGDMLGFQLPDRAVWYAHEVGELRPAGSLRSLVDRYFRKLIRGELLEQQY